MEKASKGISVPRQMAMWMCKEPAAFFELQFRKLLLFWDSRELPNNVSLYGEGNFSFILQTLLPGRSGVLLALALAGMFVFARKMFRFKRRLFLYGFILIYWGAIALFYILSRFRAPILPLTAIFAGAFTALLFLRWKKWESRRKLFAVFALAAGTFITVGAYDFYGDNFEPALMRFCRPRGTEAAGAVADNGPFTCGRWELAELLPGSRIGKAFVLPKESGKVKWQLVSPGGLMIFKVNGKEQSLFLDSRNTFAEFEGGREFEIEIISVPEKTFAIFDRRRNYHRSTFNGAPLSGEWVIRVSF